MIRTLEENIHAVIGDTTEYKIAEINNLLEEKQKEVISLANKGKDYEFLADDAYSGGLEQGIRSYLDRQIRSKVNT